MVIKMPKLKKKLPKELIPTEAQEQETLVKWLEYHKDIKFSALPLGSYSENWSVRNRNKRIGVRSGVPDMMIILPTKHLLFIEMKRTKGGKLSPEQESWINELDAIKNVMAIVCYGAKEAIQSIEELCLTK